MKGLKGIKASIAVLALAGGAAYSVPSSGYMLADEYRDQVDRLLDFTRELARNQGFSRSHDNFHGRLEEGVFKDLTLDLEADVEYLIIGQCDFDCSDMDLVLYDENWNEVDRDTEDDDAPIVTVTPIRDARFNLKVSIPRCSSEPCYYGVGAYAR